MRNSFRLLAKMEAWVDTLCLLAQPKERQQQFKNKKQPELTENRTVWKSDNQGDKEKTFIHTCKRGGDGQLGREDSRQGSGWRTQQGGRVWSRVGKAAASLAAAAASEAAAGGPGDRPHNPEFQRGNEASNH